MKSKEHIDIDKYKKQENTELQTTEPIKWGRRKVRTDKKNWKNVAERFE